MRWLWLTALVVVLDQVTKHLASRVLELYHPLPVAPLFNLTLMHNTGAAFSFLHGAGGWQRWFFVSTASLVSLGILYWLWRLPRGAVWLPLALSLVLGGALGNLADRIYLGYVVDFVDLYVGDWHWPAFNVADSAISLGAVILVLDALFGFRDRREPSA